MKQEPAAASTAYFDDKEELLRAQSKCPGRQDYKEWIDKLFDLAPRPAPSCRDIQSFLARYNDTTRNPHVSGSMVLQRSTADGSSNNATWDLFYVEQQQRDAPFTARGKMMKQIWDQANQRRTLPPNMEIILYLNDKPRVQKGYHTLPVFTFPSYFPAGSGLPTSWQDHVPFPSFNYLTSVPSQQLTRPEFFARRKQVYYRGFFSEIEWANEDLDRELMESLPRFKLANATSRTDVKDVYDVLNIKLTGFNMPRGKLQTERREYLKREYNITMGGIAPSKGNSTMSLSVPGHGWSGTSTMKGLTTSQTVMLLVEDHTVDQEGWSRDTGEIYFPLLKPGAHYIPCDYTTIASVARQVNQWEEEKAYQIYRAAHQFAQRYLGLECALDLVELIAWRYYKYVHSRCPTAFSHVRIDPVKKDE